MVLLLYFSGGVYAQGQVIFPPRFWEWSDKCKAISNLIFLEQLYNRFLNDTVTLVS